MMCFLVYLTIVIFIATVVWAVWKALTSETYTAVEIRTPKNSDLTDWDIEYKVLCNGEYYNYASSLEHAKEQVARLNEQVKLQKAKKRHRRYRIIE